MQGQNGLVNTLFLSVACENLPNLDTFSKTDAMCILYQQKGNIFQEIGRTEVVMDSLNPKFIKNFQVEYHFEERQKFKIMVYDIDDFTKNASLHNQEFAGELQFMLHEIVTARNQTLKKPLVNEQNPHRNNGQIIVTAEERKGQQNEMITFEL